MPSVSFEVLSNIRQISRDPDRPGQPDRLITYKADSGQVGFVVVAEKGLSAQVVAKAVAEDIKTSGMFVGQKMTAQT